VIVLMVLAQLYGVVQLMVLGWAARTVRWRVLLLASVAGIYVSAPVAVLLQTGWTRVFAELSGIPLVDVVQLAAYTVDPFIEETVKLLPLLALWLLAASVRRQWGLTDFVLAAAALGAGFGLTEELLRFSGEAGRAIALPGGGFLLAVGFSGPTVPGLGQILGAWLPVGVGSSGLFAGGGPADGIDIHLVWSAIAGLGLGLLLLPGGFRRLIGLLLIAAAATDHAAFNTQVGGALAQAIASPLGALRNLVGIYALAALAVAVFLDRQAMARAEAGRPGVVLDRERGTMRTAGLTGLALGHLPWSAMAVCGFVRLRRAHLLSCDRGTPDRELQDALGALVPALDRAGGPDGQAVWRAVARHARLPGTAGWSFDVRALVTPRGALLVLWAAALLPALLYLVAGGVPALAGVQRLLASPVLFWWVAVAAVAGAAWSAWNLVIAVWRLPTVLRHPAAEVPAAALLRILTRAGAVAITAFCLALLASGATPASGLLPDAHILDAIGRALLVLGLVLAIMALMADPPLGLAALAGGGGQLIWMGISAALLQNLAVSTIIGGTGVVLMQASGAGGGGGGGSDPAPADEGEFDYLRPNERDTLGRLQSDPEMAGRTFEASDDVGYEVADDLGNKYDFVGNPRASEFWGDGEQFLDSIQRHLVEKPYNEFTVVDVTGFAPEQVAQVARYLDELPPDLAAKVIRLGF
jgi:PrsW family intramembrane metalloprotease